MAVRAPRFPRASELTRLGAGEFDRRLRRLVREVPQDPPLQEVAPSAASEAVVFGDTHGDWPSTEAAASMFLDHPEERALIGLGDYIDRPPSDCPGGSVVNALYLLELKAAFPDRVFLIQGNHEIARKLPIVPHTLPSEIETEFGSDSRRYGRVMDLLERGPYAAFTRTGAYLAHAGFPVERDADWKAPFRVADERLFSDILWRDAKASELDRGMSPPFDGRDLERFLTSAGLAVFLRGHDPDVAGKRLYSERCLTLHTARQFQEFGGVLVAVVPLRRAVRSLRDIEVVHLRTEGEGYPAESTGGSFRNNRVRRR